MVGRQKLRFVPFEVGNGYSCGSGGAVSPPAGPGQSPGGGPGGKVPRSSEDPAFCNTKKRSKTYSHSVIFTFFETTISVQGHIKLGFG